MVDSVQRCIDRAQGNERRVFLPLHCRLAGFRAIGHSNVTECGSSELRNSSVWFPDFAAT
jgi:hypothetical protein